jgi:D-alanyl-lipoteichoic acid acyltransferase DltB (MBOAT superfamily)
VLFPTIDFALFFAVVFLGHWLLQPTPTWWKWFMLAASYFFYAWWDWRFMGLLAASMLINQVGGISVHRARTAVARRAAVVTAVAANLLLLGWFKYYGFLAVTVDNIVHGVSGRLPLPLLQVTLPVGISFFTFMGISYVIDIYREELDPAPWLDFAVYLSFFPHLVAGPIVRGSELLPQIRTRRDPRQIDVGRAAYLIFAGLFKKMVISSFIATAIVDPVFGAPGAHTSLEILFAIYGYAVQIYADFSGYTDIAIGVALLLGFKFPQNFDAPYAARSLQDFWRRWHITLSRWLRDYLYIPLGGSRRGERRTYVNIMLTMLLGGLWHGAAWTFVAWGALHGVGQAVGHYRRTRRLAAGLPALPEDAGSKALQRFLTFNYVCLGWVFFRSDSFHTAALMLWRLLTAWGGAPLVTPLVLLTIAFGVGVQYLPKQIPDRAQTVFSRMAPVVQGAVLAVALYAITTLAPQGVAPFIYFQF